MKLKILLADDHSLMRMGLASLIAVEKDMQVVGEASDGDEAVALAERLKPDVIIMDLMMPALSGAEATKTIKAEQPDVRILILTSFGTATELADAVEAGADGVLLKNAPSDDVLAAIRKVSAGEKAISKNVLDFVREETSSPKLSERQMEILHSASRGFTTEEIARQLGISSGRVLKHFHTIFEKLGVANRSEAIATAMRKHLLKI